MSIYGGEKRKSLHQPVCLLSKARDWQMQVDQHQRLTFPPEITQTNLGPDLVPQPGPMVELLCLYCGAHSPMGRLH